MHDLSIRKVPGVGRVNERLLESIGIKVRAAPLPAMPWTRMLAGAACGLRGDYVC